VAVIQEVLDSINDLASGEAGVRARDGEMVSTLPTVIIDVLLPSKKPPTEEVEDSGRLRFFGLPGLTSRGGGLPRYSLSYFGNGFGFFAFGGMRPSSSGASDGARRPSMMDRLLGDRGASARGSTTGSPTKTQATAFGKLFSSASVRT